MAIVLAQKPQREPTRATYLLRRLRRSRSAQLGLLLLLPLLIAAVAAPMLATHSPTDMNTSNILQAPSAAHLFGTDDFGRDIFSRVLYGIQVSLWVGVSVAAATTVTGIVLGLLSGYYPRLDAPIMRVMDLLMAFPSILLAIGIMAILGPKLINIIIALSIQYTPRSARIVRGQVMALRELEYVEAARSLGMSDFRIMFRHLIPNGMAPLIVQQTFTLALAVLAESSLSFLGVGVPPEVPTLGSILSDSRTHLTKAPWMSLYPGSMISLLVLAFNMLGDGLRDVLDPRMKV